MIPTGKGMSKQNGEHFKKNEHHNMIWAYSPSKFKKEPEEPIALTDSSLVFKAGGSVDGLFRDDPHTSWESYQKTMASDPYQIIMRGDLYPKRHEYSSPRKND